ncbi:hypothetical protein ZIOFF_053203 [Zingiber officinale]|uniref:R3H-associated N-terminal domain-containing protein n=1 Tax=Zingiber officinale TaxID=94328 RepID=A0A8J5FC48_ZINOF|nr:hypothetical protein ZIOFF_053203 [Zingiber officinale]
MAGVVDDRLHYSIFDSRKGDAHMSRGQLIEKKIDILESLAGKVSNRRSRRWLNDCLLIELVPRLDAEEIRGLFAPPPWGDKKPLSAFSMTNVKEWDIFRNIDMDVEADQVKWAIIKETKQINDIMHMHVQASITKSTNSSIDGRVYVNSDKVVVLNAWRRVDRRTRQAMRHKFLPQLIQGFEEHIRAFISDGGEGVLVLHVQDPFHRLLLHGVCEFYNLTSITVSKMMEAKLSKMTRITKKPGGSETLPNITLAQFLHMAKEGTL